jgi:hypothetical protein
VDSNDFGENIVSKLYPKYEYQSVSKGPKRGASKAFLEAINGSIDHVYGLHPLKRKGYCNLCLRESTLRAPKEPNLANYLFQTTFQLNHKDLVEISSQIGPKVERFRGKQTR